MFLAALLVALALPAPQQPPRDRTVTPGIVLDSQAREAELVKRIAASPTDIIAYQELAKLQEDRGALAEAEATLLKARQVAPRHKPVLVTLAAFYARQGNFEKAVEPLEAAERFAPTDPEGPYVLAVFYWEKAYRDKALLPAEQLRYIMSGIEATDRALALKPDYLEALTYKNLLLRVQANLEKDPAKQQALLKEADKYRDQAVEIQKKQRAASGAGE
jgi:tetratricopeptide (TPR) repeat protein